MGVDVDTGPLLRFFRSPPCDAQPQHGGGLGAAAFWPGSRWLQAGLAFLLLSLAGYTVPYALAGLPVAAVIAPPWGIAVTAAVLAIRPTSDVRHWVCAWLLFGSLHGLTLVCLDSMGSLPRWGAASLLAWMVLHLAAASAVAVGLQRASLRFDRLFSDSREAPFWGVIGAVLLWLAFAVPANVVGLVFSAEWSLTDAVRTFVRCLVIGLFFMPLTVLWGSAPSGERWLAPRAWWLPALQALGFAFVLCLAGVVGWLGAELPVLIWFGVAAFAPVRVALLLPMGLMLWVLVFAYGLDAMFMRREGFDAQSALLRFLVWLTAYLAAVHLRARLAALVRDNEASERLLHAVMSRNPVGILIRPVQGSGRVQINAAFRRGLDQASNGAAERSSGDAEGVVANVDEWLQRRMAGCELGVIDNGDFKPLSTASLLTPSIQAQAEMKIDNAYLRWPGGETRFLKLSTALVRDAQGRVSHGILYAEDRTDVSIRSQLLQAVIDAMPVGVLLREMTDAAQDSSASVLVNPAHLDLYGLTADEAFGAQPLPSALRVETAQGDVVFGGQSLRRLADLDEAAVRALGKLCPVLITGATGVRRHAALMITSLSFASHQSSYQLLLTIDTHDIEAQRRLLDAVVERLPIGFSILSAARAEPVRINARQLNNLGLTRAAYEAGPTSWGAIEMGVWSADGALTALPYRSPLQHSLDTACELDEPHAYIRRPDGSMRYVHMSTRLLLDENGVLAHVLGFAADRTELVTQQLLLGHIVRHSPVGIVVRQVRDGQVVLVNGAMGRVLSADPAAVPLPELTHLRVESGFEVRGELIPDVTANPMWLSETEDILDEGDAIPQRMYVRHEDGQLVFAKLHRVPVSDIAGQPIYHIAYAVDETLLRKQTRLLRSLIEALPTGVCVMEIKAGDPNPVYVNKSMADLLGQTPEQTTGQALAAPGFAASFDDGEVFASGDGQVRARAYIAGLMERGFVEHPRLLAITRADGSARVADLWARPIHAPDGEIEFVVLVAADQTESHTLRMMADAANNRLLLANERLSEIVSHMPCGLIAFDGRGLMLAANQMVKDMLDMPAALFAQPKVWWDDLTRFQALRGEYGEGDVESVVVSRRDILHSTRPRRYERQRVNGRIYEVSSAPLARGGIVTTYTDITERKANEAQIRQLAFYDALTGLPNRRLLLDRVGQALQAAVRNHWFGAVFFLDLDQFKSLNDTRGHDAGDALLKLMGGRLVAAVRSVDTVSRMGGDEFVVLMERLGGSDAEAIHAARRIATKVHSVLMEPYVLGGDTYSCTCSIGIALLGDASESVEAILKQADIALYQAKDAGRNAIRFFDHTMQAAVVGRADLEAGLRLALARQEFVLYYQPQIDRQGRVFGAETLLRWMRPAAPPVSPGVFIGVAEESGVIVPIGLWVFEQVCLQVAAWAALPHMAGLRVSVNLSARQLQEPDVVEAFAARLQSSGVDPRRIAIELTESLFIGEHGEVLNKLHALKALGLHLSMDDFGTGYSSLSQLHRLPLNEIKIDQAFVRDIESDPGDAAVVRAVIAMGLALGLDVVAEGVETEGQRRYLAEQGATGYQGYLFSHPLASRDIERWLEQAPAFGPAC